MDMATLAVKELRHAGGLTNLDESDEINACTIIVPVDVDGKNWRVVVIIQKWNP